MNNHITAYRYGTSTDKFDSHVFKCINKNDHVAKELYSKVYAFMTVNNKNKLLCYESYLHKMVFDTGFRQTWKNLENLEKGVLFEKVRETQGRPGKKFFFTVSGKLKEKNYCC